MSSKNQESISFSETLTKLKFAIQTITKLISEGNPENKRIIFVQLGKLLELIGDMFLHSNHQSSQSNSSKSITEFLFRIQLKLGSLIDFHKDILKHYDLLSGADYYDQMKLLLEPLRNLLIQFEKKQGLFGSNVHWEIFLKTLTDLTANFCRQIIDFDGIR